MKRIIERIKGFDIKRMFKMIKVVSSRSGESFIHIFLDIFRCWIKFGSGYMDYYLFYFETLPDDIKATYINVAVNKDYIRHCNDSKYFYILNDKPTFLEKYKEFIKRDYVDIRKCSYEEYELFFNKHSEFMAKPVDGLCGYGIELIKTNGLNAKNTFDELNKKGQYLLEERIKQNEEVNAIYADSINTLRIVTLNKNNNVEVLFSAMRIGNNGKVVDNFNNGGLMAVVDEDGVIRKPVLDKDNKVYSSHPMTNTPIVGFKVPHYDEVIDTCKKLALVTPEIGLCGWDIAITPEGVDVVEGNQIPGYDIYQSREQLAPSIKGLKEKFDNAIYPERVGKQIFGKGFNAIKFIWVFFVGALLDLLFGALHLDVPVCLNFIVSYLLCYKHIDIRPFKETIIRIIIYSLLIFIFDYCVLNYLDLNNTSISFIYGFKYLTLEVVKTLVIDIVSTLLICLIGLYFVFPFIDKVVEKLNMVAGVILTILFGVGDLFLLFMVLTSYLMVILLLLYI